MKKFHFYGQIIQKHGRLLLAGKIPSVSSMSMEKSHKLRKIPQA